MSVSTSAYLGYGWIVPSEEFTDTFRMHRENDFACADNMLDTDFGYELVTWLDDYWMDSPVFIGVPINTTKRVSDKQSWHYENVTLDELAETCLKFLNKNQELHKLYCMLMGHPPKAEATVHLFERAH